MNTNLSARKRFRKIFGNIKEILDMPNLIEVQKKSYEDFLQSKVEANQREHIGLQQVLKEIFPINDYSGKATLEFIKYALEDPKYDVDECKQRGFTYSSALKVTLRILRFEVDEEDDDKKTFRDSVDDEVYLGDIPLMTERGTFVVNGVSKAYAMTGWRVGYGAGPKKLIKEISKIQSQSTTHTSSISQAAAIEALNNSNEFINKNKKIFQERRDLIFSKLKDFSSLQVFLPQGSFYVYVCCNDIIGKKKDDGTEIKNDIDLSDYLLDEGVAVVPGEAFGCSNFFRISFATSNENIIEGCDKIVSACKKLK